MKLVFIGADHEVTGSCHYIEAAGKKILVDCGLEQGRNYYENMPLPVPAHDIDIIFLTHAHIDHSGLMIACSLWSHTAWLSCGSPMTCEMVWPSGRLK